MATVISRRLLRANPTRVSIASIRPSFQASARVSFARLGSRNAPKSRQLTTHTFDAGPGRPPINLKIEEPPSLIHRLWRLTYRTVGGILIVTFGSVIALVIYEPGMMVTSEMVRMHTMPEDGVSDETTLEIEHYIQNHPFVAKLRKEPDLVESRPHLDIPVLFRANVLTAGILSGPDRIVVPPIVFSDKEGKRLFAIQYVGDQLCGHPGIVHGGLLATLMDETLARCCFPALPKKVGMTANLDVNYRAPCRAGTYIVIKAQTTKVEGRKAWVSGTLEELPAPDVEGDGKVLVEASALMIEPRHVGPLMREVIPNEQIPPVAPISSA